MSSELLETITPADLVSFPAGQMELVGMPERPGPLWIDGLIGREIRLVKLRFGGGLDLSSYEPGHLVMAEALTVGDLLYVQAECRVKSRGYDGSQGVATVEVQSAVRADEAGVIAIQTTLDNQTAQVRALADAALSLLDAVRSYLPEYPGPDDDSPVARTRRKLHDSVDRLRVLSGRVA